LFACTFELVLVSVFLHLSCHFSGFCFGKNKDNCRARIYIYIYMGCVSFGFL